MSMFVHLQEFEEDSDKKKMSSIIVAGKTFQTTMSPIEGLDIYLKAVDKSLYNLLEMKKQYELDSKFNSDSTELYQKNRKIYETFILGLIIDEESMLPYIKVLCEAFHFIMETTDLYYVTGKDEYYERIQKYSSKIKDLLQQFRSSVAHE